MSLRRRTPDRLCEVSIAASTAEQAHKKASLAPLASLADQPPAAVEPPWEPAVGSVTGYRLFRVDPRGRLRPAMLSVPYAWRPGENVAACYQWSAAGMAFSAPQCFKSDGHRAPAAACNCGFYARTVSDAGFWDAAFQDFGSVNSDVRSRVYPAILGVIEGYGRTEIGTKGFRCEKAKVLALYVPGRKRRLVEATRVLYPDVQFIDTRSEMFDRWPQFTMSEAVRSDVEPNFWMVGAYD